MLHEAQLINYLNAVGIEVGLLVNFGRPEMEYHRLHRTNSVYKDEE